MWSKCSLWLLEDHYKDNGGEVFSVMSDNITKGNGQKNAALRLRLDIKKTYFTTRIAHRCNRLPRGAAESLLLEVVKTVDPWLNCSGVGKSPALSTRMDFPTNTSKIL